MATDPTPIQTLIERTRDEQEYAAQQLTQELAGLIRQAEAALASVEAGGTLPGGYDFQTAARRVQEADTARLQAAKLIRSLEHVAGQQ